jgi:hypothetical protein
VALFYAYSNQHPDYGHKVIRSHGKIVIRSQVVIKAFYLRYCILLLQGCGDKLAQLVRSALGISKWKTIEDGKILEGDNAKEENTRLQQLRNYLKLSLKEELPQKDKELFEKLFNETEDYLRDKVVRKVIFEYGNAIKHRWQLFYQGEGLEPIKPEIRNIGDIGGRTVVKQLPIGVIHFGEDIEEHIRLCLYTNNMFVDMANAILEHLNFDQFYEVKNGKKMLNLSKA